MSEMSHDMSHEMSRMSHLHIIKPNNQLINSKEIINDRKLTGHKKNVPKPGKFTEDRKKVISYLKGNYSPSTFQQYNIYKGHYTGNSVGSSIARG
jgi:hypothetical protein